MYIVDIKYKKWYVAVIATLSRYHYFGLFVVIALEAVDI